MNKLYFLLFFLIFPVLIFSQTTPSCAGVLNYEFYNFIPSGDTVDNIPTVGATAIGEINNFDPFSIQNSIDGEDEDSYSIRYSGYIEITVTGNYTFYTTSDDGSKLYIDGVQMVDNDGDHSRIEVASTGLNLSAGFHEIEVLFYEKNGASILEVGYEGPSVDKQLIPFSKLYNCLPNTNTPPEITASGNLSHCIGGSTPIVESIHIEDDQDQLENVFIQISTNYDVGDLLSYDNSVSKITSSWSASEGKLTLTGPATVSEFEAAILAVRYSSTATLNDNDTKDISIVLSELNFLESTGHYYEYVPSLHIEWRVARTAAEARNFYGVQGYLATITSTDEAALLEKQTALGTAWIGATDESVEGVWEWVTGPEAGLQFWQGGRNGDPVNGMYSNWAGTEPNNHSLGENYAYIRINAGSLWYDTSNRGSTTAAFQQAGYLVEYGGLNAGETFPQVSAVTKITAFTINIDTHPQNKTVFAGDNALFTAEAKSIGIYQWQVDKNDGDGFTNLSNGKEYSGVNTQELNVLNADINKEGYKYRMTLAACKDTHSNEAILTVQVRTVVTNRNQTYRVNKI